MSLSSVVITGANRGIGLEFVRQLLSSGSPPKHLVVTSRQTTNEELDRLKTSHSSLHVLKLDIKSYKEYDSFVSSVQKIVGTDGIDTLINNAGININKTLNDVTAEDMLQNFEVNTVTPLMLTKALLPLLKLSVAANRKAVVVNISSKMGSIEDNTSGGLYPYRTSKTALNMVSKSLAVDLKPLGINVVAVHPGWVQTDMGGPKALITPSKSVSNMLNTIKNINDSVLGKMLNYDGAVIPY